MATGKRAPLRVGEPGAHRPRPLPPPPRRVIRGRRLRAGHGHGGDQWPSARLGLLGTLDVNVRFSMLRGQRAHLPDALQPGPAAWVRPVRGRRQDLVRGRPRQRPTDAGHRGSRVGKRRARDLAESIAGRLREAYGLRTLAGRPAAPTGAAAGAIVRLPAKPGEDLAAAADPAAFRAAGEAWPRMDRVRTQEAAGSPRPGRSADRGSANRRLLRPSYVPSWHTGVDQRPGRGPLGGHRPLQAPQTTGSGHGVATSVPRASPTPSPLHSAEDDFPVRSGGENVVLLRNPARGSRWP